MVCLGIVSPMYPMMGLQIAKANEAQVKHSDARWIEKSNSPIILRQEAAAQPGTAQQHTAVNSRAHTLVTMQ